MDVMADAVMTQFVFSCWQTNCTVHIVLLGALTQHATSFWACVLHTEWRKPYSVFEWLTLLFTSAVEKRSSLSLCTEKLARLSRHLRSKYIFLQGAWGRNMTFVLLRVNSKVWLNQGRTIQYHFGATHSLLSSSTCCTTVGFNCCLCQLSPDPVL